MNLESRESANRRIEIGRIVDSLCDDIEAKWSRDEPVDIAAIAHDLQDDAARQFLQEIIHMEFKLRKRNGDSLRDEYGRVLADSPKLVAHAMQQIADNDTTLIAKDGGNGQPIDYLGKNIGEYVIQKKLGGGGFGVVYLASDKYLPRDVVIKIPRMGSLGNQMAIDSFLDEARNASMLSHPNILRIMHVGVDSNLPFIVQEFFEGGDLKEGLKTTSFTIQQTISFVAKIAKAIGYAHQNQIIHRDLKPANILINQDGDPVIADFGLSLHEPHLTGREGELVGTIRFMSPEQVRAESHRLDGRTDIWSIGVILYLMLCDQFPFDGNSHADIAEEILFGQARPPAQLNREIDQELERICLKCLANRVNDRYRTANDLAEDLDLLLLNGPNHEAATASTALQPSNQSVKKLAPKGLAAFDGSDRDFFLGLLPGPRDRNGVPDCVGFWKTRIENVDSSSAVSLLFGPSGSGKSSLVSAGIIPILDESIIVAPIESTPHDTEVRFLKALRTQLPSVPTSLSLPELVAEIRRGQFLPPHKRILIVFDQFEQWLHGNVIDEHSQLINALRQCDGHRIQVLILAREDFWMGITRFFRQLDTELVERKNFASVDLFSKRHTKKVLTRLGQAYGSLPEDESEISAEQDLFLDKAVDLLADKDQVICVKSALFAETCKNQPWEPDTINKFSDTTKIGVAFLEQSLGRATRNPKIRAQRERILKVLESLLPVPGVEIKGNLQSVANLAACVNLPANDPDFVSILQTLDGELRLITPTEPDMGRQLFKGKERQQTGGYYQLTHDYLVPALREWLVNEKGSTLAGRSKMRLAELSRTWNNSPESRFLPGLFEFLSIRWNVSKQNWEVGERKFMRSSALYFGLRTLGTIFTIFLASLAGWILTSNNTDMLVSNLLDCKPGLVQLSAKRLMKNPARSSARLNYKLGETLTESEKFRIHLGLALIEKASQEQTRFLVESIATCPSNEGQNLITALSSAPDLSIKYIEELLPQTDGDAEWCRLQWCKIFMDPRNWDTSIFQFSPDPTRRCLLVDQFESWHGDLEQFPSIIEKSKELASAESSIYQCLGCLTPNQFSDATAKKITRRLKQVFNNPNSELVNRSSCQFVLNKWKMCPSIGDSKDKVDWDSSLTSDWWEVNGLVFRRVKNGVVAPYPTDGNNINKPGFFPPLLIPNFSNFVERDFYICTTEVTATLFEQFCNDTGKKTEPISWKRDFDRCPSGECPVESTTYEEAIEFCNWLSNRHGLPASYKTVNKMNVRQINRETIKVNEWQLVDRPLGFRLPLQAEWLMSARCNQIVTPFHFGRNAYSNTAQKYCWNADCFEDGSQILQPVATSIPNQLGIFDMIGNAWEWQHGYSIESRFIRRRGGGIDEPKDSCLIKRSQPILPGSRRMLSGIRLVITAKK